LFFRSVLLYLHLKNNPIIPSVLAAFLPFFIPYLLKAWEVRSPRHPKATGTTIRPMSYNLVVKHAGTHTIRHTFCVYYIIREMLYYIIYIYIYIYIYKYVCNRPLPHPILK
jgi:hypothetical protein